MSGIGSGGESEIKTFNDFLNKIKVLPSSTTTNGNGNGNGNIKNKNYSKITPPPQKPTSFLLTLKPLRGAPETLRVSLTETVGELRKRVASLFKISDTDRCRLIRGGKALSDDKMSVEGVFGVPLDEQPQILHVLEKPAVAPLESASTSTSSNDWKSAPDHVIWSKIDNLLMNDVGVTSLQERASILDKFRKSLL